MNCCFLELSYAFEGWGLEPQGFEGSESERKAGKDFLAGEYNPIELATL